MKLLIVTMVLVHLRLHTIDCTQIFLEDVGLYTAYCSSPMLSKSRTVEVYLIKNNISLLRYVCVDLTAPCQGVSGHFAIFNTSGSYFPLESRGISDMRQISGVKCLFKNNDYTYKDNILIIAKPQSVACNDPATSMDNKNISMTCLTAKVYPQAVCTFDMQYMITGTITYSHVNYSEVVEYYNTTCTWTALLNNFAVEQYQYNVSFFPNVTNNNMIYGSCLTQSINLTLPSVNLSNECFIGSNIVIGYIKPGTTLNCICYTERNTFPPPFVSWLDGNAQEAGTALNSSATRLNIPPASDTQTFSCILSTNLKDGCMSLNYTVTYAKKPSSCIVELKDPTQTIWSICNKENTVNVSIVCSVNKTDVKPGMKSIIYINSISSGVLDSEVNNTSDNMYRTRYEAVITQAGDYTIYCQVQNSLFDDLKTTCTYSKVIQVSAPPESAPILQITNTTKQNVEGRIQENEVYEVECIVLGGIPLVSNVTVSCGNIAESTQSGNIFTSSVTFTRNMTGHNCTCTAKHITGCYTKKLFMKQLNILYASAVSKFYTGNINVIDNGTWTMFVCEADGNPLPQISILKDNFIVYQNAEVKTVFLNKTMSCKDAGIYVCEANNNIINKQDLNRKNVTILVKCPLQFNASIDDVVFSYRPGQLFVKTITIYGYPEPNRFSVIKDGNSTDNVLVQYTSRETPYFTVILKILNLVDFDFGNYSLRIFQNESDHLVYNFTIFKDNEYSPENVNVGAAVGGTIAALVVIAIIVVIIVFLIRKKPNIFKRNKETKTEHSLTYSEMSVTPSIHDRHTYETPVINENFSKPYKADKNNASYCNVTANDVDIDYLNGNRSPYCNTNEVHEDLFKVNYIVPEDKEKEESPYVEVE